MAEGGPVWDSGLGCRASRSSTIGHHDREARHSPTTTDRRPPRPRKDRRLGEGAAGSHCLSHHPTRRLGSANPSRHRQASVRGQGFILSRRTGCRFSFSFRALNQKGRHYCPQTALPLTSSQILPSATPPPQRSAPLPQPPGTNPACPQAAKELQFPQRVKEAAQPLPAALEGADPSLLPGLEHLLRPQAQRHGPIKVWPPTSGSWTSTSCQIRGGIRLEIKSSTSLLVQWLRLCSQCRRPGFDPWSGNWISHATIESSNASVKTQHGQINK